MPKRSPNRTSRNRDHTKEDYIKELRRRFPKFSATNDEDELICLLYDPFGSFMLDVINRRYGTGDEKPNYFFDGDIGNLYAGNEELDEEIGRYFEFIEYLFEDEGEIRDVLNVCLFESLHGSIVGDGLAREYLSEECYDHYASIFQIGRKRAGQAQTILSRGKRRPARAC